MLLRQVGGHCILNHRHPLTLSADPASFFSVTASKFTTIVNPSFLRAAPTLPLSEIVMSHQCSPDLGQLAQMKNALSVIPAEVYIIHDQHHT